MAAGKNGGPEERLSCLPLPEPAAPEDIVRLARRYGPACIEALAQVAAEGTDASRVAAARALLARGYGKEERIIDAAVSDKDAPPVQALDLSGLSSEAIMELAKIIFNKDGRQ